MVSDRRKMAIVCAGGPAPGINSVIGGATMLACRSNVEVLGIQEGFRWLMEGDTSRVVPLTIADTSRIHFRGGSTLGISRANPTKRPEDMRHVLDALHKLDVGMLVTIRGDDTAFTAYKIGRAAGERSDVVRVP